MILSTLCYLIENDSYPMLHRVKKEVDVNSGKWIGVGGKFKVGESPEECVVREVFEETGFTMEKYRLRGILTFSSEGWEDEIIFLYTSDDFHGTLQKCDEGELKWIPIADVPSLNLWDGDRIFLKLLEEDSGFFSLKLSYKGNELVEQKLVCY